MLRNLWKNQMTQTRKIYKVTTPFHKRLDSLLFYAIQGVRGSVIQLIFITEGTRHYIIQMCGYCVEITTVRAV